MATTDRMPNLDSRREITDRLGETVVLGNSVESVALDIPATIAAGFAGKSDATSNVDINTAALLRMDNASFGIWAVDLYSSVTALLRTQGAAINAGRSSAAAAGLMGWNAEGELLDIRVFTSTTGYTPTPGTSFVIVHCLGAGGGGGGAQATGAGQGAAGGGGGGGAFAVGRITSGFSGVTITVGAGGAGSTGGPDVGTAGGASSFGSFLIAGGGGGGTGETAQAPTMASSGGTGGAASGTASLHDSRGQAGDQGFAINFSLVFPGEGGSSIYGCGGRPVAAVTGSDGLDGIGFGAGGAGAGNGQNQGVDRTGGSGTDGLVIVYEYSE